MRVQQQEGQDARREAQNLPTYSLSASATRGRAASTASCEHQLTGYTLDGLAVHRSDAQRVLILRDLNRGFETVLRFTPLEYAILVPLLEQYGRLVTWEQLSREAFASPHHLPPEGRRPPGGPCAFQQVPPQLRLGGEANAVGDAGRPAARAVARPGLRQVEGAVEEGRAARTSSRTGFGMS